MSSSALTALELDARRQADAQMVVLDVRLPEDYASRHIAGSLNNCVFEVAFLPRLDGLMAGKDVPVCVYGESAGSHEATVAAEKLTRAGYSQVYRLEGCLTGWCAAGLPVQGSGEALPPPAALDGTRLVDMEESRVEWLGRNLLNKHWGRVPLKAGHLQFENGSLKGGELVLDMTGITSDDLAGNPLHDVLIDHLCSDDFFDVALHPEARLAITHVETIQGATPGAQNLRIDADLTLRGVTAPVSFTASAGMDTQGRCAAQAAFSIDRTRWGVLYGSGRYFSRLAGHLVNDLIEIQVRIVSA